MPRSRPATTGYERLAQADQFSDESDDDNPLGASFASLQPASAPRYAPISQPRPHSGMSSPKATAGGPLSSSLSGARHGKHHRRRMRSNSGVDLKAINARLERWADEIAAKFKRSKKRTGEEERLEIHHSVFQAPEGVRPATAEGLAVSHELMSRDQFEAIVESVRIAIEQGVHPRMIAQGSSGSYFARNTDGKVVGVFKPKDEEPYAAGNPKWNKWIHRNLFPCCFGRACLIPNLSYVSEAAAYVLDTQLRTHMVPYTDVVNLSSKSFHYPFWDRYAHSRNRKPLPAKPGSFQVFLKGFKDANIFLREHPWPDQYLSGFRTNDPHRSRNKRWADCRPTSRHSQAGGSAAATDSDEDAENSPEPAPPGPENFAWTEPLKQSFRVELEKLVILDYIMRNTDRGLDNWMIKVDWPTQEVSIVSEPLHLSMNTPDPAAAADGPRPVDLTQRKPQEDRVSYPYRTQKPMNASSPRANGHPGPKITIGAIDNSLSWPWKHPDAWRSFPFGWLFLPVDLIGRPFSQQTRDHFLPLLTSTAWWSQTQLALRRVFQIDPDFQERMFARQMAVMKGQAWNVVETLKTADHGPLELTRRAKVCVWDDLVDVPVAVPMRVTSAERRFQAGGGGGSSSQADFPKGIDEEDEEMDIGSAAAATGGGHSGSVDHLLDIVATPPASIPNPGRFELTSDAAAAAAAVAATADEGDIARSPSESMSSSMHAAAAASSSSPERKRATFASPERPGLSRTSYSGPTRPAAFTTTPKHERRFSFATAASRRNSNSIAQQLYGASADNYDEDVDGDLGYAAAEGMEGNRRKVIVERLEPVKGRNPVFSWC